MYQGRGQGEQALACFVEAASRGPTEDERIEALKSIADQLLNLKRFQEAEQAYEVALAANPADEWAWHNRSLVLFHLGRLEDAFACNDRALSLQRFGAAENFRERVLKEMQMRSMSPPRSLRWL